MNLKKIGSSILAVVLATSLLVGCGETTADKENKVAVNPTGFPIVKDKITVNAFAAKFFASANWNELLIWKEYEKMTNVHINWETVQTDQLKEKRNIVLASGEYPDLFFASAISKTDLQRYGNQGVFVPLNDLIEKHAPNFKKLMEKYPEIKKAITMPDGKIYSFPTIYDPEFRSVLTGTPWMKKEWLDQLKLKEPGSPEDFYNVLKAIKEKDPNGNGKADEIPWGGEGVGGLVTYLKGVWGLGNRGASHPYVDLDPNTNNLRFFPTDAKYKEMLQFANKLYKDGLLDKEIFTLNTEQFYAKASKGNYGFLDSVDPTAVFNQKGYIGSPVLKGPYGDQMNTGIGSSIGNTGMFAITSNNPSPEAMVRWMDYFYSDEGSKLFFMGIKDKTYKELPNGEVEYTEEITKNPKGLSLDQAVGQYMTWPGGYYPGFVRQKYFKGAEGLPTSVENAKKAEPYTIKEVWPAFNNTAEEIDEMATLKTDIETYVNEMRDKFVSGQVPFSEWNQYVETINKMNLKRYMEIYQAGYQRYQGK